MQVAMEPNTPMTTLEEQPEAVALELSGAMDPLLQVQPVLEVMVWQFL
jgi:hypothetical protein